MDKLNLAAPESVSQNNKTPINPFEAQKSQAEPEPVFFNVMPKSDPAGPLTEPKIKVQALSPEISSKLSARLIFNKYKTYIFIGLGVVLAGIGIYIAYNQIKGSATTDIVLVKHDPSKVAPASKPITATSDFTTPQAWRDQYFTGCTDVKVCGDNADPDNDGLTNVQENKLGTDPNNKDSDQDGLADGDEVNVFGTDPLNSHTAKDPKYSDADFIKGGFDISSNKKMSPAQIASISAKMAQFGLHQPSLVTLGSALNFVYNYTPPAAVTPAASSTPLSVSTSTASSTIDQSIEAKQGRDFKRSETIQNLESALVKYQTDNKSYPMTSDFNIMYSNVKLYLKVATNPIDPINSPPYVYAYASNGSGSDFSLSFYSEVAGQIIKKNAASAIKDAANEEAAVYDNQRQTDLESIRMGLLLYSQNNVAGNQDYVFPTKAKYKTAIVPDYIPQIPKDPKTGADYSYEVSATFNTFTLKTPLDNPTVGTTGYMCNQDGCNNY